MNRIVPSLGVTMAALAAMVVILQGCGGVSQVGGKAPVPEQQSAPAISGEPSAIQWETDMNGALAKAKEQGKKVLIDFYTEWCGFCKKMDEEVYPDAGVASLISEKLIAVKVDAEQDRQLAQKYSVQGYPTTVIVDAEGAEIGRIVGFRPAGQFREELSKML
jgi:thiol:disulfide interchange protein